MIILQTGVPGSGKTLSAVYLLMSDESYTHFTDKDGVKKQRPLFVNGIPELKIEHNELTDEQIKEQPLQDFLPYGSLVVIDEAQRLMGMRSPAKAVPPFIEALAMHRHHGLDILLITQHPSFLDSFVRRLVQRHMHISIKPVGRKLYEWNECQDQPDSTVAVGKAVERNFSLPKKAFEMYKSAEVHTKPKRRLPKSMIFLMVFLPLLVGFFFYAFNNISGRFQSPEEVAAAAHSGQSANTPADYGGMNNASSNNQDMGQNLTPEMFVPTIPERPDSKPLYNPIRQVQAFERIAACVSGGKSGCACYSDQGTPLKEISEQQCRSYAENGLPFDPFRSISQEGQQIQNQPMKDDS